MKYKVGDKVYLRGDLDDMDFNIVTIENIENQRYTLVEFSGYYKDSDIDHEKTKELNVEKNVGNVGKDKDYIYELQKENNILKTELRDIKMAAEHRKNFLISKTDFIDKQADKIEELSNQLKGNDSEPKMYATISNKQSKKSEIFKDIINNMAQLYKDKNEDYGDSFRKVKDEFPNAILIRLMDKLERLKNLYKGKEMNIKGEDIDNVLIDMANYCVMEMVERRIE